MGNIEEAMVFIEEHFHSGDELTEYFIRELHSITVTQLEREGDATPGAYRQKPVQIAQSEHLPPEAIRVPDYMQELVGFINADHPRKYDLIKVALAHHRFGWIHPFGNGNGRVLNPTAVFCNDRDQYYAMLSAADKGTPAGLETWCVYVLQGILDELRKVDRLADFDYLSSKILAPALTYARERELITAMEEKILHIAAKTGVAKSADFEAAMSGLSSNQRTYQIRKLVDSHMLQPIKLNARQYTIGFSSSYLIRGVILALSNEGFIPAALNRVDS